jgi:hypothetical protein
LNLLPDGVLADRVIATSLTDIPPSFFSDLGENDVLFFDGSHLCFHGSDVPYFFLRVLPVLKEKVIVHVHDIFLPDEYPERCDRLHLNEQYILGAFLFSNPSWETLVPVQFCYRRGMLQEGTSFWMRRIGRTDS